MTKAQEILIIKYLQDRLKDSDKMWDEGKPHAQIVGFLQGTIKLLIIDLDK